MLGVYDFKDIVE